MPLGGRAARGLGAALALLAGQAAADPLHEVVDALSLEQKAMQVQMVTLGDDTPVRDGAGGVLVSRADRVRLKASLPRLHRLAPRHARCSASARPPGICRSASAAFIPSGTASSSCRGRFDRDQ